MCYNRSTDKAKQGKTMNLEAAAKVSPKQQIMPTERERAKMAIELSNKFKAKAVAHNNNDLYLYANLLWVIAYQSGECTCVYEDAGEDAYYDLAGISIDEAYGCIPIPFLQPTTVAEFMKRQPSFVSKQEHQRVGASFSWEELMPEFVFLSLFPEMQIENGRRAYDDLWMLCWSGIDCFLMIEGSSKINYLPQNLSVYNSRGNSNPPIHEEKYHEWVTYKGFKFKTFKNLASIFESPADQ